MAKVLVGYFHRPQCAGLYYPRAFRRLGHQVMTIGPGENFVYGHADWADYVAPDIPWDIRVTDVNELVDAAKARGFQPDMLFFVDQYDFFYVAGTIVDSRVKFVHLAVENFDPMQRARYDGRKSDAEFYQIGHSHPQLIPPEAEWVAFGADPEIHPLLNLERTKWTAQIGTPYEPRPSLWTQLRARFDGFTSNPDYNSLQETPHTYFGKIYSYAGMAEVYNRSLTALSCSNVDFCPMRIAEAFAMGCVLLSDDVPSMRHFFGMPYPEDSSGIWMAHDRTPQNVGDQIEAVRDMPAPERKALVNRAYVTVMQRFLYEHVAQRALERVGLC